MTAPHKMAGLEIMLDFRDTRLLAFFDVLYGFGIK